MSTYSINKIKLPNGDICDISPTWDNIKSKPTISSPNPNGTDTSFIDTITQVNGTISATKKTVPIATTSENGLMLSNDKEKLDDIDLIKQVKTVSIEPVQDLHGYDHPWPAGGGACVLRQYEEMEGIEGVTLSVKDGKITINGTVSATYGIDAPVTDWQWDGVSDYWLSGCPSGGNRSTGYSLRVDGTNGQWSNYDEGNGVKLDGNLAGVNLRFKVVLRPGTYSNLTFAPMLNAGLSAAPYSTYSNICPISGWTGANVTRTGVNIWDEEWEQGGINDTTGEPNVSVTSQFRSKNYIPCKPNTEYFAYFNGESSGGVYVYTYDREKNFIGRCTADNIYNLGNKTFTTPDNALYLLLKCQPGPPQAQNDKTVAINYPASDTSYHPYTGTTIPISWQSVAGTVYGGTLDVTTGMLTVTMAEVDMGTLTWTMLSDSIGSYFRSDKPNGMASIPNGIIPNCCCSNYPFTTSDNVYNKSIAVSVGTTGYIFVRDMDIADAATFKTAISGVQLVYELATPQTYQLTPTQILLLAEHKHVWADCGDVTLQSCFTNNAANVTGIVNIDHGGTGATTAAGARTNLGLGTMATETAADYLKLSGGTMTGPLKWSNSNVLPERTSASYFLAIDAFANGGTTCWINSSNVKASLALTKSDVGLGNVANSTYAGGTAVTLNNSSKASSTASFYAPTAGGTADTQALVGNGATSAPKWVNISPSITIGAGTSSTAPTVNVTVLGQSGTAQSITTASTSVYGVTKLNDGIASNSTALAATANSALIAAKKVASSNSTSKLYLVGATSQSTTGVDSYSYQYTYTNNGLLSALKVGLNLNGTEKAHLEWNNTDQSIDFIFE